MLVLARHLNEQIVINGGEVVITVLQIGRGQVRLGFTAPPSCHICRREVLPGRLASDADLGAVSPALGG